MPYEDKNKQRENQKRYYQNNKEKLKEYQKEYWKKYYKDNRKKVLEQRRRWRINNPEKIKEHQRKWKNKRRKFDIRFHLDSIMGKHLCRCLKNKKVGRKWESLVGYKVINLISHLEKQFDDKMCWNNYGSYWHIDHIIPKSWFIYDTPEDIGFKMCWDLDNLQPMEKIANIKKGNKYIGSPPTLLSP